MNLKSLVYLSFSSFGMLSSADVSIMMDHEQQRRGSLFSQHYRHQHDHDATIFLPSRQLLSNNAIRKDELCSDNSLRSLEDGLEKHFSYWLVESIYDDDNIRSKSRLRYTCKCQEDSTLQNDQQQQQELMVHCHGHGTNPVDPQRVIDLQDAAIFEKVNDDGIDNYVLKTTWWGDSHLGNASIPQEIFHYDRQTGQLDSCHGNDCHSCSVCASGRTVEVDCLAYQFTCNNNYTGGFFNQYDFFAISEEEQIASSGGCLLSCLWTRTMIQLTAVLLFVGFFKF